MYMPKTLQLRQYYFQKLTSVYKTNIFARLATVLTVRIHFLFHCICLVFN